MNKKELKEGYCFKCGKKLDNNAYMCKWCARESELKATEEYRDKY